MVTAARIAGGRSTSPDASSAILAVDSMRIATRRRSIGPFSLRVGAGDAAGLVGPNGSGKTTLLRLALGLDRASAGRSMVNGHPVDPWNPPVGVGAVFEADGWLPWLTGRENLMIFAQVHGLGSAQVAARLEEAGLVPAADTAVRKYSRGMRQRLAIARAQLDSPALLVLDEPTVALDPSATDWLLGLVGEHLSRGGAAVIASHDFGFLEAIGARPVPVEGGTCG